MTTSERLGHILVAIPIAHILGSAFFLWSYCLGFGANLVVYASAADLFSVSISDMVRVYAVSLIFPLAITLMRLTSATPYAVDVANALPADQQERAHAANNNIRRLLKYTALVVFIFFGGHALYDLNLDKQFPYYSLWIALSLSSVVLWAEFCEVRSFSHWTFETGTLLGGFIMGIFFIGAMKGQSDRFITYKESLITHTTCSKSVVLRQISNKYLAILPEGSRALISEGCNVVFRVPPPRGRSLFDEPKPTVKAQSIKAVEAH